jgi:DNA-binding MarR family transcriptional regulator
MSDDDEGGYRWSDPETSKEAARSFRVGPIMFAILETLARMPQPRNGWELSQMLQMPTITVVPRLAPLRRHGLIELVGTRPGPSNRSQGAYIITAKGRGLLSEMRRHRGVA